MEYTYAQRLAALEANERVASRTMHATFNEIESRLAALEQRMEEMLSQAEEARQERALADAEDDNVLTRGWGCFGGPQHDRAHEGCFGAFGQHDNNGGYHGEQD